MCAECHTARGYESGSRTRESFQVAVPDVVDVVGSGLRHLKSAASLMRCDGDRRRPSTNAGRRNAPLGTISVMSTLTKIPRVASETRYRGPKPRYVSAAETRRLLARGSAKLAERLRADDMVTPMAAAQAADVTMATVRTWIDDGRAIAVSVSRSTRRLPRWQFEPAIWEALPQLSKALNSRDSWMLLSFLETPLGGLGGLTPRQALEQGQSQRVLALAIEEA